MAPEPETVPPIIIMGVQGSGKTTLGVRLAQALGVTFVDGDTLHSVENKELMASGTALTDEQRGPWLEGVGGVLARDSDRGVVVACSALKRRYRDQLRRHAPGMVTVFADGDIDLIRDRISARKHEYMPRSLLRSQFDALEERDDDEAGITVNVQDTPDRLVEQVLEFLRSRG